MKAFFERSVLSWFAIVLLGASLVLVGAMVQVRRELRELRELMAVLSRAGGPPNHILNREFIEALEGAPLKLCLGGVVRPFHTYEPFGKFPSARVVLPSTPTRSRLVRPIPSRNERNCSTSNLPVFRPVPALLPDSGNNPAQAKLERGTRKRLSRIFRCPGHPSARKGRARDEKV